MTYINALEERKVFDVVRFQLTSRGYSFRQLFIFTGIITFFLSPIADNLTTALVMCSVLLACGKGNTKFISIRVYKYCQLPQMQEVLTVHLVTSQL